jgi:predicted RNA polymerase sigma factor
MSDSSASGRDAAVGRAIDHFNEMVACPSERLPGTMPMAAAVAPRFAQRYPEAAAIFDNLHALHDVVSDILASPTVPLGRKRAALLAAAAEYRDDEREVTTVDEWREMSLSMGVRDMGGPGTVPANGLSSEDSTPCKPG